MADTKTIKNVTLLFSYLFIVWGFYRLLFQAPEPYDEMIVKPIVWLVPLFIFMKRDKMGLASIGVTNKNLFSSIYFALVLGSIFAFEGFIINYLKYKGIQFSANLGSTNFYISLFVSFVAAVSEELVFRGYIFTGILKTLSSEWKATIITSLMWCSVHIPIALFDWKLPPAAFLVYMFLIFLFGFGSSFVFAKTRNIVAPILLHVMWAWPIILFR